MVVGEEWMEWKWRRGWGVVGSATERRVFPMESDMRAHVPGLSVPAVRRGSLCSGMRVFDGGSVLF